MSDKGQRLSKCIKLLSTVFPKGDKDKFLHIENVIKESQSSKGFWNDGALNHHWHVSDGWQQTMMTAKDQYALSKLQSFAFK